MLSSQGRELVAQHDEFDVLRELGPQPTVRTRCALSSASGPAAGMGSGDVRNAPALASGTGTQKVTVPAATLAGRRPVPRCHARGYQRIGGELMKLGFRLSAIPRRLSRFRQNATSEAYALRP
jgi:hypothetical protein